MFTSNAGKHNKQHNVCVYIYIYIERERDYVYVYIYIYIYMYVSHRGFACRAFESEPAGESARSLKLDSEVRGQRALVIVVARILILRCP